MRIINPKVEQDIAAGRGLRLHLGSGLQRREGFYNVDRVALPGVDIVADLNEPLAALPGNCVTEVYSRHVLEHVQQFLSLLAELHRVARSEARLDFIVPHFSNPRFYSDPTHVRFFGLYSFYYFCDEADQPARKVPSFYAPQRFQVESVRFHLMKESLLDRAVHAVLEPLVNRSHAWRDWYERRMCRWFPISSVRYVVRPKKAASVEAA